MRHLLLVGLLLPAAAFGNSSVVIVNGNAPGVGFNDPTPATPVGGNPGTTVGQQRLIAFQHAADLWAAALDSRTPVRVAATFEALTCTPTSAVLGSAGALSVFRDFPGAPHAGTWFPVALANKLAGTDLSPGDDLRARFNSSLNGSPTCLGGVGWYYGLDGNHGQNIDLVTVLLHELGHGLGFQSFVSVSGSAIGQPLLGLPDAFMRRLFDDTTRKSWEVMTDAERAASMRNGRALVWTGPAVTAAVPSTLAPGTALLRVSSPESIAGAYAVGSAAFGPPLHTDGVSGEVVVGLDEANPQGPSPTDGCSPLTNAASVVGRVALLDRGTCGFVVKVKNAQNAGAIGVLIADNAAGSPPAGLGGADPTIVIPSVRITRSDGARLRAALASGPVAVTLLLDASVRAGADPQGRALMYATDPIIPGSTVSHWDTSAFPNLLMEPNINADLTHALDLTLPQLRDVGWYPDADLDLVADTADACLGSDLSATVVIDGCNSGVTNWFFPSGATAGCSVADLARRCAPPAANHGGYVSCVSQTTNGLKSAGVISGADKGALQSCAARAALP